MVFPCYMRIISKKFTECACSRNKLIVNSARTFYNDRDFVRYIADKMQDRYTKRLLKQYENLSVSETQLDTDDSFAWFSREAPKEHKFTLFGLKPWLNYHQKQQRILDQCFQSEKVSDLGTEIAAADFVLQRGGKVQFKNMDNWIKLNPDGSSGLPDTYDPTYRIVSIDFSGFPLEYEGLDNIACLVELRWLSLRGSETIDDWCLDKLSGEYPMLEYLDISDCKNVSERGLEALYRMPNLKKLIVTNHYNSAAFELTCFLLEDVNPYLNCEIRIPEGQSPSEE